MLVALEKAKGRVKEVHSIAMQKAFSADSMYLFPNTSDEVRHRLNNCKSIIDKVLFIGRDELLEKIKKY